MNWRILLFVPALAVGIFLFRMQVAPSPGRIASANAPPDAALAVRVRTAEDRPLKVVVSGFGRVRPVRTWEAVSRVEGRVEEVHPNLAVGTVVEAGDLLVRVDPRDYEIARDRAAANLMTAEAQLTELDASEDSLGNLLDLEREIEALASADVERNEKLVERGAVSATVLDRARRDLIAQERRVVELENQIALIPVQRRSAEAAVRSREVELEEAERDLSNVVVRAPFEGRVAETGASEGENIRPGDRLALLEWTGAVEIAAGVQPARMQEALRLVAPNPAELSPAILSEPGVAEKALAAAGVEVVVRSTDGGGFEWPATIVRTEGAVDSATGTFGIVVRVEEAVRANPDARRPRLRTGAFVEVWFRADAASAMTVPRSALVEGSGETYVYVADADNRLARAEVEIAGRVGDEAVVAAGLSPGDRVVLAPPRPKILGQALVPVEDVVAGANE